MKRLIAFSTLLAMIALTGCGIEQPVQLSYAGTAADAVTTTAAANDAKKLYLIPFDDGRPEKQDIGSVRNIFGVPLRHIVLTNDPAQAVTTAVRQELEKAGFEVVMAAPESTPADAPALRGEILDVTCCTQRFGSGMISQVTFNASVTTDGGKKLGRTYSGEGSKNSFTGLSAETYQAAMSGALQNAVEQLVADVNQQAL